MREGRVEHCVDDGGMGCWRVVAACFCPRMLTRMNICNIEPSVASMGSGFGVVLRSRVLRCVMSQVRFKDEASYVML